MKARSMGRRDELRQGLSILCFSISALVFILGNAFAAYPERPIRLIVPFPAGNSLDVRARQLGNHLPALLGQQVVIDNRGGASGIIAMEIAAKAPSDGYTVLFANSTQLAAYPALTAKLSYDVFRDYAPVSLLAQVPSLVIVSNAVPAKSLQDLIALARTRPGELNFASQGNGSTGHLAGELFMQLTHTRLGHVPYKAYSQIVTDLLGGQVALIIGGPPVVLPFLKSGKLRALAVNTEKRLPALPDVPTFAEDGVPGFWIGPWYGVLVPARTPASVIRTLNTAFNQSLKAADIVELSANEGQVLIGSTPEAFSRFMRSEAERYRKLARETGARID